MRISDFWNLSHPCYSTSHLEDVIGIWSGEGIVQSSSTMSWVTKKSLLKISLKYVFLISLSNFYAFTHEKAALYVLLLQCLAPAKGAFWKAAGTVSFSVIDYLKYTGLPYNGNWPLSKAIKKLKWETTLAVSRTQMECMDNGDD